MSDLERALKDRVDAQMVYVLAPTAAPFVAAGMPTQKALERALDLIDAAVAYVKGARSSGEI